MVRETFCALPWLTLATSPSGSLRVCCNGQSGKNFLKRPDGKLHSLISSDIAEAWNCDTIREVRRQMLRGERPESCAPCFKQEDVGVQSPRESYNIRYFDEAWEFAKQTMDGVVPVNIRYLDLRLGNRCNLRCVMCSPHSSDQWLKEWDKVNPEQALTETDRLRLSNIDWPDDDAVMAKLEPFLGHLDMIYLAGGEPMLAKSQYKLLDMCVAQKAADKIEIKYNSNVTSIPDRLVDLWAKFKKITFHASIDAYGDLDEYIRFPTKWAVIDRNLRRLDQLCIERTNMEVRIHCCVQIANIFNLPDLLDYLWTFNGIKRVLYPNLLNQPSYYSIRALPAELKEKAAAKLQVWLDSTRARYAELPGDSNRRYMEKLGQLGKYMRAEDLSTHWPAFLDKTTRMDRMRNLYLRDIVVELKESLDAIHHQGTP